MIFSNNGMYLLKELEGLSLKPYKCAAGKNTIGYGHVILHNEYFRGVLLSSLAEIRQSDADELLRNDIKIFEKDIKAVLENVSLNQNQYDAIVCFVFNVGVSAFRKSSMLKYLISTDIDKASLEFSKWNKVTSPTDNKKLVSKGLTIRRKKEQELFLRV